jgi:hypothetical protein
VRPGSIRVGGALTENALMAKGNFDAITRNVQPFVRVVREATETADR